jgi:NitT/TauT family transport system substrate-binding protein
MILMLTMIWLLGSPVAGGPKFKPEKTKILLGMSVKTATYLPMYLAKEQGFWEEEGLTVEFAIFRGGSALVKAGVGGSVDIGSCSLASMSRGVQAGKKMKIFYAGINPAPFYWCSVPSARFGVTRYGSNTDFLTRYALKANGLDPEKDVKIVQGGRSATRMAAMQKGQIDVNIFASPDHHLARDRGYNVILQQKDLAPESAMQDYWAMEEFIKNNPNTIKAFLRGHVRGVRLAKKDRARSIKTIVKYVGLKEKYAALAYDDMINHIYEDGRWPGEKSMNAFWEMGIMSGTYKAKWPPEKYFDSTFVDTYSQWKP